MDRGPGLAVDEGYHWHSRPTLLEDDEPSWASNPKHLRLNGEMREFHLIGAFAEALGRSSQTIRLWERTGILPPPQFSTQHIDFRARRRLYLRETIEGVVRIADEEGILNRRPAAFRQTRFTQRCVELYRTVVAAPPD